MESQPIIIWSFISFVNVDNKLCYGKKKKKHVIAQMFGPSVEA